MPRMGLTAEKVVAAAAELADREGYDALILAVLAEQLGVRVPSLYKHIGGLDDLQRQVARLGAAGLSQAVVEAAAGKVGREAFIAAALAYRRFAAVHPGRYTALTRTPGVDLADVDDVLYRVAADYGLTGDDCAHAGAALHSAVAGFIGLDVSGDTDAAFFGVLSLLDRGLAAQVPARRGLRIPGFANLAALPTLPGRPLSHGRFGGALRDQG